MIDKELIHQAAEDIDIFEVDLTIEYDRLCTPRRRHLPLWPWVAAACVAGIALIFLAPPEKPETNVAPIISVAEHIPIPEPTVQPTPTPILAQQKAPTPEKPAVRNRPKPAVAEKVPEHPIKAETEEEQQIREFMRQQEELLLAIEMEMSQMDIRSEIALRGKRMIQAFESIEYQ